MSKPGTLSLIWQIIPPMIFLFPLVETSGQGFVLLMFPALIAGLWSVVSLVKALAPMGEPRWKLTRPVLTLTIIAAMLIYMNVSMHAAYKVAHTVAAAAQAQCNADGKCSPSIPGWEQRGKNRAGTRAGNRVQWPLSYFTDGNTFVILIHLEPDGTEICRGGVGVELKCPRG